ncbi:DiGeorge syndrome critical region protein 14 [Physocladia obscura]|uniref:DiGeorge syndrome critical region protein 14 n=1 Tax=Physocladia obscura TaxID=109957 RepID=A0AAD5SUS0_9FUNG|nr:DiGeorge syndrome critical region protein 14 [Physocladia obscura]
MEDLTSKTAETTANSGEVNGALVASGSASGISLHRIYIAPPPRPAVVLEEDEYLTHMSTIIERDFFPDLTRLKTQNEFLTAVETGNLPAAKRLGEKLQRLATPSSLSTAAPIQIPVTPTSATSKSFSNSGPILESIHESTGASASDSDILPLSLDAFQSKYISEDNESFSKILQKENEDRKRKYIWYFEKEDIEHGGKNGKSRLLLEDIPSHSLLIEGSSSSNGNPFLIEASKHEMKQVQTWKYQTKNALMYYQPAAPETLHDVMSKPNAKLPPKSINHSGTRIPTSALSNNIPATAAAAAAAGARLQTQEIWRNMAAETPGLFPNGVGSSESAVITNTFVPSTPSLEPHADIDPEDLMTWGMIEGTPILVDSGADHGGGTASTGRAVFRMPETPRRDVLADKLAERARRDMKMRTEGKSGGVSNGNAVFKKPMDVAALPPVARLASPAIGSCGNIRMLSPAAIRLAGKIGGKNVPLAGGLGKKTTGGSGRSATFDSQLRASYSPKIVGGGGTAISHLGRTPKSRITVTGGINAAVASPLIKTPAINMNGRKAVSTPIVVSAVRSSDTQPQKPTTLDKSKLASKKSLTDNLLDF